MAKYRMLLFVWSVILHGHPGFCQIRKQELYKERGFIIEKIEINRGISTTLIVAVIDPSILKVHVEGYTREFINGLSPLRVINSSGNKIILGSGFVKSFYPLEPNGFLKIRAQVVNETNTAREAYTEIVGAKNGALKFLSRNDRRGLMALDEGFQTGPPLLLNNVNEYARRGYRGQRESYNRSFVGINNEGKIIVAVTEKEVQLSDLAKFLFEQSEIKELKCKTIINLSGGTSEALIYRSADGAIHPFGGGVTLKQASMLVFK